jgi:hypothetical protein
MRYLSERSNGDYRYVRDFPTPLLKAYPSHPKQFSKELGLTKSCTDSELHRAMDEAPPHVLQWRKIQMGDFYGPAA